MTLIRRRRISQRVVPVVAVVAATTLTLITGGGSEAMAHEAPHAAAVVDPEPPDAQASYEPFVDDAPIETDFDLNDAEISWYAERHGISLERSLEIANWMTQVGPVIEGLDEELEGNYAQVRVVHGGAKGDPAMAPGEVRVELRMVDLNDPAIEPVVKAISTVNNQTEGVDLSLRAVPKSLKTLQEEAAEARLSHPDHRIDFDFDRGTLVFNPPEDVALANHDCPSVSGRLEGGRKIGFDVDGGGCNLPGPGVCSAGLAAFMSGRYGITTAGHCFTSVGWPQGAVQNPINQVADSYWVSMPNTVYASGYPYYADDGTDDDVGFIARRLSSTVVPAAIYKHDTHEWRLTTHHEWSARALGLTLCISGSPASANGASTYCGEVIDEYVDTGNVLFQRWTKLDMTKGRFNQGIGPGQGGSGSPAFWGGTAYGNFTACLDLPDCKTAYVYQVRYLWNALKAYSSDAKMLCDNDGNRYNMAVKCEPS